MALYHLTQKLSDVPLDNDWLTKGEAAVLATMKFPKRRNDWRLGRWTAKKLLKSYMEHSGESYAESELEVRAASDGAPEAYRMNERLPLVISISHSMNKGFSVLSPNEPQLGCDLEYVEKRDRDFLLDYFAEEEVALAESFPPEDRSLFLTLIWSGKESALKTLREGLRRDTKSVVVSFERSQSPGAWNELRVRCAESGKTFFGWWRTSDQHVETITSSQPSGVPIGL